MKTELNGSRYLPGLLQLEHNSNAWIGHQNTDAVDRLAGQTFRCPENAELDSIELYSASVQHEGRMYLTFHSFDEYGHAWGPVMATAEARVGPLDREKWIRFQLPRLNLEKDHMYGFRVQSSDTLVAIGETALDNTGSLPGRNEWNGDARNDDGRYFRYFSLAYRVELFA